MISLRNLTRRYGSTVAVADVSTEIRKGEIVGLLGHNGAGKTTVMKILTGFLEATDGTVEVDGLDVATDRAAVQQRIGYLPENAPLYEEMTVADYLVMMAELRGVAPERIGQRVAEVVAATALRDRLDQRIGTLSKGLRQRVGIAQAIVHEPAVLVLDEPTNGLDPMQIQAIRELVRRLGQTTTILLSTHILQEIEAVCDRVLVMIDGHLVADAPLAELRGSARLRLELADTGDTSADGGHDVAKVLGGVDGVTTVERTADGWSIGWHGDSPPVPAVLAKALEKGWTVAAIAPEVRTLETVFQELQEQHIARAGGAA